MTWQDPNAEPGSGGSGPPGDDATLDETRTDWAPVAPAAPAAPTEPPAGQPPSPWAPPPGQGYPPPTTTSYDALGQPYPSPAPGYTPPGMTWAPPPDSYQAQAGMRFADVGPRFAAWLVDTILLSFATGLVSAPVFLVLLGDYDWGELFRQASQGNAMVFDGQLLVAAFATTVITTVINAVYFVFLWSSGGRATLGMRLLKLQIGNAADGATLSLAQSFKRWLAFGSWLSLLGVVPLAGSAAQLGQFVWSLVLLVTTSSSPTRQGLHDRFAKSAIVQTGPAANPWVVGCGALVVAMVAGSVFGFLFLTYLFNQV